MGKTLADGYLELRIDPSKLDGDTKKAFKALALKAKGSQAGKDAGDGLAKGFSDRAGVFGRVVATTAAKLSLVGATAAAATPGVLHLTAALLPAAGALVAMPAAIGAVKLSIATLKVATDGVSKAISAGLTGSSKQAKKALEGLAPAARTFAGSVIALKPKIEALKTSVSARLFAPIQNEVGQLARVYLPLAQKGMGNLAGGLGGLGKQFAETAKKAKVVSGVSALFSGTSGAVAKLRGAVGPLTTAFGTFLSATAPFLPRIAAGFTDIATKVAGFVRSASTSGKLSSVFSSAVVTLKDLGGIAGNVASILGSVFKAAAAGSGSLLSNFRQLTGQAAEFLRSGQGIGALSSVFETLSKLGGALRSSLGAVLPAVAQSLQALAPSVSGLVPAAAQLVVAVAPLLPYFTQIAAAILTKLTPAVAGFAQWLTQNTGVLKVFVSVLGGVALILKLVSAATSIASAATKAWSSVQAIANGVSAAWNSTFVTRLRVWALDAGAAIRSAAATAASTAASLASRAATVLSTAATAAFVAVKNFELGAWIRTAAATVASTAATVAAAVASKAAAVASKVFAAGQWLVNAALSANPIGLVVAAIVALIGVIVLAYKKNESFRNLVNAVWTAIKGAISSTVNWLVKTAWPWIKGVLDSAAGGFRSLLTGVKNAWSGIKTAAQETWAFIRDKVFTPIHNAITKTIPNAFDSGVKLIKAAWGKVQDAAKKPIGFVVTKIVNPFIGGINSAASFVGIKAQIPKIPWDAKADGGLVGYQDGGRIAGAPSSRDNRLAPATIPGVGAVKLAGGEFVVNAADTARALPLLRWVNAGMRGGAARIAQYLGKPLTQYPGDGSEGWAFKDGGLVGWVKDVWGAVSHPVDTIKKPFLALMKKIPGGGMIKDFLIGTGKRILNGAVDWLVGGSGGGANGNVTKAQAFVRQQAGKPYVWASAGPTGFDCSGIVSAVYNVMKGTNPYSHTFSTEALPGSFFRLNKIGALMAGWSHPGQRPASATVGHMAGQIGGLPFESTGSGGVRIGGAARRFTDFANRGGAFARGGRVPVFDTGGTLAPGLNTVYNGLGRPERLTRSDTGNTYNITVNVAPGGHPAETGRQIVTLIQAHERANGSRWRA